MNRRLATACATALAVALSMVSPALALAEDTGDAVEPAIVESASPEVDHEASVDEVVVAAATPESANEASLESVETYQGETETSVAAYTSEAGTDSVTDDVPAIEEPTADDGTPTTDDAVEGKDVVEGADASTEEGPVDGVTTEEAGEDQPVPDASEGDLDPTAAKIKEQAGATSAQQKALDDFAAAHAHDIADGTYKVASNLGSNLVLDVSGASKSNGGGIIVWTSKDQTNQRWVVESVKNGYFTIASAFSGKFLDISGGDDAAARGAKIVQWAERNSGSLGQYWIISRNTNGSYRLTSALLDTNGNRLVLDVSGGKAVNGAKAILWDDKNGTQKNQCWTFSVPADVLDSLASKHKGDLADGTYLISSNLKPSDGKNLLLDITSGSMANKAAAIVFGRAGSASTVNEGWEVVHNSKGYATIFNAKSGKVLDVSGATAKKGAAIIQWTDNLSDARNQQWIIVKNSDGSYRIVSALAAPTYLVLDVSGGKAVSGSKTILWSDNGTASANQRWTITKAPEQYAYAHDITDATYVIDTVLNATKALDVTSASKDANMSVKLFTDRSSANQKWKLTHDGSGYVHLTNVNSGLQLGIYSGNAAQVKGSFAWVVEAQSNGSYRLRVASGSYAGKYLDLKGASVANGTVVYANASSSNKSQTWYLDNLTTGLNGVDISGWNTGINYSKLGNFVIIKATEWNPDKKSYTTYNDYKTQADKALAAGKLIGFYHFATAPSYGQSMTQQAQGFLNAVSVKDSKGNYKYLGKAVLFLDWENAYDSKGKLYSEVEVSAGVGWAKQWLDYVYKKTGSRPMIYMNKSCTNRFNWSSVKNAGYDLWGAQYLDTYYNGNLKSFVSRPTLTTGWGAWGTPVIYQYTSTCTLHGSKQYDVNKYYGTKSSWLARAAIK